MEVSFITKRKITPERREQIVKEAVYIDIRVKMDGVLDVSGMWVGENESVKYWLGTPAVCLKAHGVMTPL